MPRPRKSSYRNTRPPFSYISLCAMAIESSPSKMMTLQEMYEYVSEKFEFYRYGDKKWKNSLRHNLSFNDCFIKVEASKAIEQKRGRKGSYWTMHPKSSGMFLNGSTLRRKIRFREEEMARRKAGDKVSGFKSPRRTVAKDEDALRRATHTNQAFPERPILNQKYEGLSTHTHHAFSDRSTLNQKYPGLSIYDRQACNSYGQMAVPSREAFCSSDTEMRTKALTPSTFTIESILKPNKKERRGDTPKREDVLKKGKTHQSSVYSSTQHSIGAWRPTASHVKAFNRRAICDERIPHTKRYNKRYEISPKQPLCRCPYCVTNTQDVRCFCEMCYIRYLTS